MDDQEEWFLFGQLERKFCSSYVLLQVAIGDEGLIASREQTDTAGGGNASLDRNKCKIRGVMTSLV